MGIAREFGSLRHLAARFFGALSPAGPPPDDDAWARSWLLPGEVRLWERMSGPDRRHAVGVARDALRILDTGSGDRPSRPVVASALLHDVGKVESGLGTFARVAVTAAAVAAGRERLLAGAPAAGDGRQDPPPPAATRGPAGRASPRRPWRERCRLYLTHDRVGSALLQDAGSDTLTVAWALEHHLDPARWTVERRIADALKAADGD